MKKVYYLIIFMLTSPACKKNNCQVCSKVVVGPDIANGGIIHDTIYANNKYCGDQLDQENKDNGKYTEYSQGGNTYRWTTQVHCH